MGIWPREIDKLKTKDSGARIREMICLTKLVERPSRSSDFLLWRSMVTFRISASVIGKSAKLKTGVLGWPTNSGGRTVGWISAQIPSATEVKKTLKLFAMSFSSVKVWLATIIEEIWLRVLLSLRVAFLRMAQVDLRLFWFFASSDSKYFFLLSLTSLF